MSKRYSSFFVVLCDVVELFCSNSVVLSLMLRLPLVSTVFLAAMVFLSERSERS